RCCSNSMGPTKRNVGVTHVTERPFSSCGSIHRRAWPSQPRACRILSPRPVCAAPAPGPQSSDIGATSPGARADWPRLRVARGAHQRLAGVSAVDVLLEDIDELVDQPLSSERPVQPAI